MDIFTRRCLPLLLAAAMILAFFQFPVFAEEDVAASDEKTEASVEQTEPEEITEVPAETEEPAETEAPAEFDETTVVSQSPDEPAEIPAESELPVGPALEEPAEPSSEQPSEQPAEPEPAEETEQSENYEAEIPGNVNLGDSSTQCISDGAQFASVMSNRDTLLVDFDVTFGQSEARTMLSMINEFRTGGDAWYWNDDNTTKSVLSNLSGLTYNYTLEKIAMQRAAEIAISFSHTRPDGSSCFTAYSEFGYTGYIYGENIAVGYSSASSVFAGWQEADEDYSGQGHRRNMLSDDYTAIGIGHVYYNGTHYWVQEFGAGGAEAAADSAVDSLAAVSVSVSLDEMVECYVGLTEEEITLEVGGSCAVPGVGLYFYYENSWPTSYRQAFPYVGCSTEDNDIAAVTDGTIEAKAVGSTSLIITIADQQVEIPITVTKPSLANAVVALSPGSYAYTGQPRVPDVSVTLRGVTLTQGKDYTVSIRNNTAVGTATVTVTGIGDYIGTTSATFAIKAETPNGWVKSGGYWYYYRNGVKQTGWLQLGSTWYYLRSDGVMQTGWTQVGGKWFYMNSSGVMQTGWLQIGGKFYYLLPNGQMATGWAQVGGKWFYMNGSGVMQTGWLQFGSTFYYLLPNGQMATGWAQVGGKWFYMNGSGVMQTGWLQFGSTFYYLLPNGQMATGWAQVGGKWFYMNGSGVMQTGWLKQGDIWYYLLPNGQMAVGWIQVSGKWYYLYSDGHMAANSWIGNYYVDASGVWIKTR